jgi:hypothetical protein
VANFATFWCTDTACFAGGERRHIVVQHEIVFKVARQRINTLRIALCTECRHDQSLCFTTGEQR